MIRNFTVVVVMTADYVGQSETEKETALNSLYKSQYHNRTQQTLQSAVKQNISSTVAERARTEQWKENRSDLSPVLRTTRKTQQQTTDSQTVLT